MSNTVANGSLLEKSANEIMTIFNKITEINDQGALGRSLPKRQPSAGIFELDIATSLQAQIAAMNKMLKTLTMEKAKKALAATSATILDPSLVL